MKSLQQHINERLVLSKNNRSITSEEFCDALDNYTGKYAMLDCEHTFSLETYCEKNNYPKFYCADKYGNIFVAEWLMVQDKRIGRIRTFGEYKKNKMIGHAFNDFDDFIEKLLDRNGEHNDDPTTGEEHLQNIYDILIRNK
jgi:hypothetical protein